MTTVMMDICQRITSLLPGGNPDWMQQIENYYNESTRYYHTLDHVCCMFKQMDRVLDKLEDTEAVSWAIVFHDIIYDPEKSNNELKSAQLFQTFAVECLNHWSKDRVQKVVDWILATQSHTVPDEHCSDLLFFLDLDLQVLGWPEADYDMYSNQIRKEYSFVPEDVFNQKRPQVMIIT
ncbi:hypothetical protein BSL78_21639 [Apostichopus japonicus]|uniref:Metal-dependent HD superfamily phosphohydrolase n=1 Tax=Stichopus japonicus TaxID=307972 RepID=A0A2G8K0L4_STIJA|nr:hypothetical protein BSL78_21639 [Apostichopus japonicus]